jgi:hypothetical protein
MKIGSLYGFFWLVAAVAFAALYLTGSFNYATTMIFGFSVSILAGAAPLMVFPLMMSSQMAKARATQRN